MCHRHEQANLDSQDRITTVEFGAGGPGLASTRYPVHVHHAAKCTGHPTNFFLTLPYFKNQLRNNHLIDQLVIKERHRLIVNEQYYKLVLALLKYFPWFYCTAARSRFYRG
jgi:hypothetical protein